MANVENNNRIAGFVKKHIFAKRWVSIMLVIALLVTTVTMYALNKSATAVSEDSAESVGMVLDTASEDGSDDGSTEEVVAEEPAEETQEENNESTPSESEVTESTTEEPAAEASEETENTESESTVVENTESTESNESEESESESTTVAETENTEETDNTEEEAPASQSEGTEETENTENTENTESTENTENTENPDEELVTEETEDGTAVTEETEEVKEENELTQDVVLTVSYKDENGENIADDKAINLENSIDFTEAAPKQEGYIFKDARLDDAVITKITVEYDVNMFKYYVVTREDGSTEEVKEDKTVVLTYTKEEIAKSEIKLTAKFADKNGESIKEDAELNLTSELDVTKKENVDAIDNYFYMGATYNGEKIAKIAPVTEKTEEAATEEAENAESNTVSSYVITTKDGAEVSVTEDAEVVFTYYAAITETEFKVTNDKVTVTATLSAAGAFPEGIELNVTEVNAQTQGYNYDAYMKALNDNADKIAESNANDEATESTEENVTFDENNTILYDVAFMLEGIEYQPLKGSVNVKIAFNDKQLTENLAAVSEEDITVVHLPIKEEVKENAEITSTEEATDISASDVEVKPLTEATAAVEEEQSVEFKEDGFSIFAIAAYQSHAAGTDTYKTVLGEAVSFGILADEYELDADSQTNFAAKKVSFLSNQTGTDLTNYVEQTFIAAELLTNIKLKGFPAYFFASKENTYSVTHENESYLTMDNSHSADELRNMVGEMIAYTRAASADLAGRKDNVSISINGETGELNLMSLPDNATYYVTINDSNKFLISSGNQRLSIYKKSGQTIVFNIVSSATNGDTFEMQKCQISTDGGPLIDTASLTTAKQEVPRTIIWNFISAQKVKPIEGVVGVFLSGRDDAWWSNDSTCAGWICFHKVTASKEFHNNYPHNEVIGGTAQFQAYKYIAGSAANISDFSFRLSKKTDSGWEEIETVKNNNHDISFNKITYDGDNSNNDKYHQYVDLKLDENDKKKPVNTSYFYKIEEVIDQNSSQYAIDKPIYVQVDVTLTLKNVFASNQHYDICYQVGAPKYYYDEECKQSINGNVPIFNNKPKANIVKVWNGGNAPSWPWLYVYVMAKDGNTEVTQYSQIIKLLPGEGWKKTISIENGYNGGVDHPLTYSVYEINAFKNGVSGDILSDSELNTILLQNGTVGDRTKANVLMTEGSTVAGFKLTYSSDSTKGSQVVYTPGITNKTVTLTNTKEPTKVIVKKVWGNNDPGAVAVAFDLQIALLRKLEGEADDKYQEVKRTTLTKGQLQVEFDNLPAEDNNGNKYVYSAAEYYGNQKFILNGDVINGFQLKAFTSSTDNNVTEIQFTNVPVIEIEKEWTEGGVTVKKENAKDFSAINVELYQSWNGCTEAKLMGTYSLSSENDWHYVVEVPRGYGNNNQQYTYYIVESGDTGLATYYAYEDGKQTKSGSDASKVLIYGRNKSVLKLKVVNERGVNTLPSTGGTGTMPFAVGGLGIATLGLLGFEMSRKRKRED